MKYDPQKIEKKWQKEWEKQELYKTPDSGKGDPPSHKASDGRRNYMLLTEFPYPSGNLHIGHWYAFALPDMRARYLRMKGHNVMYPIGFDAFGLPAENAAIKNKLNPRDWTEQNIAYMTQQLKSMGATFDWSREVRTIDPDYYKWTQWMFLKFYEKGLAYRAKIKVNWCPTDKTVLANEQVINGRCERDDTPVEQREIEQWMFKITDYADQLVDDLEGLDWPETTKLAQKNWIGRSKGALIEFKVKSEKLKVSSIEIFTTRSDTIYGATFLVVSPELAKKWIETGWKASDEVKKYITTALSHRELDRLRGIEAPTSQEESGSRPEGVGKKTGVPSGFNAINPATNKKIPVWIADYVIGSYGTGAVMAVPAHDERDREFAEKFNLEISDAPLKENNIGVAKTNYRLRDWVLSRQRYWGVPIPMIHCSMCGYQPVPESELPVPLPELNDFKPADDGRSPLAKASEWAKAKCPGCGMNAERETDTMDTFVDSSWYFMRYTDPKNSKDFASKEKMDAWLPVPMYVGGAEHNTMHLLYSRFFTKALYDLGHISFNEPFLIRRNHGDILGPNSQRMSKSRGNVIDPDEQVALYGADTVRMYLAFMGPYDQTIPWDSKGIQGVYRFLNRVWKLGTEKFIESTANQKIINHAIKKVGEDIDDLRFNTAVSELMKTLNVMEVSPDKGPGGVSKGEFETFLKLLAPMAPHIAEEIWHSLGHDDSIHGQAWPEYDAQLLIEDIYQLPIQVNGKLRDTITVSTDSEDQIKGQALASEKVKKYTEGKQIQKILIISRKMISIVTS